MSPRLFLRAMQPLRSSTIRPTSILPIQLPSAIASRRLLSSTPITQQEGLQESNATTSAALPPSLRKYPYTLKSGTVVSVGRMERTVTVEHRHTIWDSYIRKNYPKITRYLVSDPQNSLREGDVIEFSSGAPKSRHVRHVVERIIAPFGDAIEDRPAVLTREERDAIRAEKRAAKAARREQRRLESGATPSDGVHGQDHVGRIRRLVLERTADA
ncbi:hypothetical protein BJY01DRAFT_218319 [Aspergillus pseudoustus]|uniref:Nucleic acid-binding protein n=1 Tax=Aspergillus pseudoustus TaxID=1810923 RepID=A0ABR4JKJ3_9EURO